MDTPRMTTRFAREVEHALATLPTRPARSTRALGEHPVRAVLITAAVLALLVPASVLVLISSNRSAPSAHPGRLSARTHIAACSAAAVKPFTCDLYLLSPPDDPMLQYEGWFDVLDGVPRLVVGESENQYALPLQLTATGATALPVAGWPRHQLGCFPHSDCALDRIVERIFTGGAQLTRTTTGLRIAGSKDVLRAVSTGRPHRYAQLQVETIGNRTLLEYHDNGMHLDAADGGRLTVNKQGCLTDGTDVLVLPDTTELNADGSIDIAGRHVPLGTRLHLGGGEGPVPADQRCGTGAYFYGWGA